MTHKMNVVLTSLLVLVFSLVISCGKEDGDGKPEPAVYGLSAITPEVGDEADVILFKNITTKLSNTLWWTSDQTTGLLAFGNTATEDDGKKITNKITFKKVGTVTISATNYAVADYKVLYDSKTDLKVKTATEKKGVGSAAQEYTVAKRDIETKTLKLADAAGTAVALGANVAGVITLPAATTLADATTYNVDASALIGEAAGTIQAAAATATALQVEIVAGSSAVAPGVTISGTVVTLTSPSGATSTGTSTITFKSKVASATGDLFVENKTLDLVVKYP